jgi:hypothetical protein
LVEHSVPDHRLIRFASIAGLGRTPDSMACFAGFRDSLRAAGLCTRSCAPATAARSRGRCGRSSRTRPAGRGGRATTAAPSLAEIWPTGRQTA